MFESVKLCQGEQIDLDSMMRGLQGLGYERQERILEEGDLCRRGSVIDIYPFTFDCPLRIELHYNAIRSISSFDLSTGKNIWKHQLVIIPPDIRSHPQRAAFDYEETPLHNFVYLRRGDYVVHTRHGIGKYLGTEKVDVKGVAKTHLIIEYAHNDILYVPIEKAHLVQKYINFEGRSPRLYRLGSGEWRRMKERTRRGIVKIALGLLELQARRQTSEGFKFSPDTDWQKDFERTFAFKETVDQKKAMQAVRSDMESSRPMDRLLCGDVGYGKTEVAMRACFKATMDNRQVAFLVPTTILAEQHYQNFLARLKDFPVNVAMISRFRTKAEQTTILKALQAGQVDIIIGTHRLLSDDVRFKNLGLLIVDEEQKFGVRAKEKIKKLRSQVDILTLTATPIPRTLYMALMGARDISVINTPPGNRIPVQTFVGEFRQDLVREAFAREMKRRGQVFFIFNRVEGIEKQRELAASLSPSSARVQCVHGQMPPRILEQIMLSFLRGDIDILVATNIIESGIDVPNANTIIVNSADMFGLSDLHQLRGRVGRFDRKAYAYFLIPKNKPVSPEAHKRLSAIAKYSELGAGFKIAMEDLRIRGAGNLLGIEQHGYIMSVGFDLYCRLLRQAVVQLKHSKRIAS